MCLTGNRSPCCMLLGSACSGSKVTTQTSSELPRYQIRTIALLPFTTLTTPQVRDAGDMYLSTPQSVRRSDIPWASRPTLNHNCGKQPRSRPLRLRRSHSCFGAD